MDLFAKFDDPTTILMAIVAASACFLILRANRYFARQRQRAAARSTQVEEPAPNLRYADRPESFDRLEVEIYDRTREMVGRLDSKMVALQALIAEADRAAARLEAAKGQSPGPRPAAPAAPAATAPAEAPTAGVGHAERRDEIYTLADYGYESLEIARRVGVPVGEVELTLSLRPRGGNRGVADR